MSETGRSDLPRAARPGESTGQGARNEPALKVEAARGELASVKRALRIQGEVTRVTSDGTATILTDQGEVDVKLRGRATLQPGQDVELDIPPGTPPRQVTVRPAPEAQTPETPAAPVPARQEAAPPPKLSAANIRPNLPLPPEVRVLLEELASTNAAHPVAPPVTLRPPTPLPPDAIIRLIPLVALPPADQLLPPPKPVITTSVLPPLPAGASAAPTPPSAPFEKPPAALLSVPAILPPPAPSILSALENPNPLPDALGTRGPVVNITAANTTPGNIITSPLGASLPDGGQINLLPPILGATIPAGSIKAGDAPASIGPLDARVLSIAPDQSIKITADDPSTDITLIPAQNSRAAVLRADVIATTSQNTPILSLVGMNIQGQADTPDLFIMQFPASNLPVGTQIELVPQTPLLHSPAMPLTPGGTTPAFDLLTGWTWPVFDDAATMMVQMGQAPAAQALINLLPNPANPQQMPAAILFLMAAAGTGDLSGWIGEKALNILRRDGGGSGKGMDLLSRLTRDFAGLSNMMDQPVSQDWKAMALPMLWQGDIHKIHLYYRHQNEHKDEKDKDDTPAGRSTRFIFDLSLSNMGDVQLDGLMKGKRLDLILRTAIPFAHSMQSTMRQKYLDILEGSTLTGDLAFQGRSDQFIRVAVKPAEFGISA